MFMFGNFTRNCEDEPDEGIEEGSCYANAVEINVKKEHFPNEIICHFKVNDVDIHYVDQTSVINKIIEVDSSIKEAENNHSDLVEGIYEGGLKIWECTYDLANYLTKNPYLVTGKLVLDLGCGSGILGILAYKLGAANVHFQDYNEGVINHLTIPNVAINDEGALKKSKFWSGDWKSFCKINNASYDVILTSETIYNPKNQRKLLITLKTFLKSSGIVILGGKSYYFGVGGSMKQFVNLIEKDGTISSESIWKSEEGIKREIVLIRHN